MEAKNEFFDMLGKVTVYVALGCLAFQILLAAGFRNKGECLFGLWGNLSYLSFVHWLPMVNMSLGAKLDSFFYRFSGVFRSSYLPNPCDTVAINDINYNKRVIYYSGFIDNSKEVLLVYFAVLLVFLGLVIVGRCVETGIINDLKEKAKWNMLIRLHVVVFLEFIVYASISLKFYNFNSKCSTVNFVLAVFYLVFGLFFILFVPIMVKYKIDNKGDQDFNAAFQSISSLVKEFKPIFMNSVYQYYTLLLMYRFSFGISLVFLENSSMKLLLVFIFQIVMILYLMFFKPFTKIFELVLVLLSETLSLFLIIAIYLISSIGFSESIKDILSIFIVANIWTVEVFCLSRFFLRLFQKTQIANTENTGIIIENQLNHSNIKREKEQDLTIITPENNDENYRDFLKSSDRIITYLPNYYYKNGEVNTNRKITPKIKSPIKKTPVEVIEKNKEYPNDVCVYV